MRFLRRLFGAVVAGDGRAPLPAPSPARDVTEVIARMREIDRILPQDDGIAHFNRMYLHVTEDVWKAVERHDFEDREFVERLDVVFANLYFKAVTDCAGANECPKAWTPLVDCRGNRRIAPIQFAVAGMNAHINHDLALALVQTCTELTREPRRDTPQYRDFAYVNTLLGRVKEDIEPSFKRGILSFIDRLLGRADEVAEIWSIERARDAAWVNAEALWTIRHDPALSDRFVLTLARTVGLASRGLLIPAPL